MLLLIGNPPVALVKLLAFNIMPNVSTCHKNNHNDDPRRPNRVDSIESSFTTELRSLTAKLLPMKLLARMTADWRTIAALPYHNIQGIKSEETVARMIK